MNPRNAARDRRPALRGALLAVAALAASHAAAPAQGPVAPLAPSAPPAVAPVAPADLAAPATPPPSASLVRMVTPAVAELSPGAPPGVVPAGCSSCGSPGPVEGFSPGIYGYGYKYAPPACDVGCVDGGCGEAGCVAGRPPCEVCEGGCFTRLFCAFHNAICCPDPCYEPRWEAGANAALFVPAVRPGTYMRLRWDYGHNLVDPDRAEYFWGAIGHSGPGHPERKVNYHELSLYAEMGTEKFSFFIDTPYRSLRTLDNGGAGGFGDLSLGTKSVLVDSELFLATFQFKTTIPTGLSGHGIGTGHVSLEPSLLYSVKLYPGTWWQGQLGYWIPVSGTSGFDGGVVVYNNSINHVLCRPLRDTAIIGTIETSGWTFTAGSFTDPLTGAVRPANNTTYFNIGPGLRVSVCDKVDFGFGVQFAVTNPHFAQQLYRTELRWRF